MSDDIRAVAKAARAATVRLAQTGTRERNDALEAIAQAIENNIEPILRANAEDMAAAQEQVAAGKLAQPLVDRMRLTETSIRNKIVVGVRSVMAQPDPLGRTMSARELDEGLKLFQVVVPIGVIGVVFESRPDALVQIATLCLKSGNASLLKGGSEALNTNRALAGVMREATKGMPGIPDGWMHLMEARADVAAMLELHDLIDLIVPRGSNELVQHIMQNTKIPVTGHADGICHVYVDAAADVAKAVAIAYDAKTEYVSVCNAMETLLVHKDIARRFLPEAAAKLRDGGVEIRGDAATRDILGDGVVPATDADWATEYLELVLSIKVVADVEEAIEHINRYSSHHTDAIVTEDATTASRFLQGVDSASVMHNASTRFADGYRYGLGAELGISTGRIHSRGPVGLEGLVIYKYIFEGNGHIAADYTSDNPKPFTHREIDERWER